MFASVTLAQIETLRELAYLLEPLPYDTSRNALANLRAVLTVPSESLLGGVAQTVIDNSLEALGPWTVSLYRAGTPAQLNLQATSSAGAVVSYGLSPREDGTYDTSDTALAFAVTAHLLPMGAQWSWQEGTLDALDAQS